MDRFTCGTMQASPQYVLSVHFSPTDSRTLASAGPTPPIRVWDIDSGEILQSFEGYGLAMFSPDGRTIATGIKAGDTDCDVLLVNSESGELRLRLSAHQGQVRALPFSNDASTLASGSSDRTCRVRP